MATKHTNTTSARKLEETKNNRLQSKGERITVNKRNSSSTTKYVVEEEHEEELVPKLSNELILLVTLVISVLLFLSNFRLSGTVGEWINQIIFCFLEWHFILQIISQIDVIW